MSKATTTPATEITTPAPKATPAPVKLSKKALAAIEAVENGELDEEGKIASILYLWVAGVPRKEIIAMGFNKTTVYRQVGEFEKLKKAPALEYYGYELFESRVQKVIKAKKLDRKAAVEFLLNKDLEK